LFGIAFGYVEASVVVYLRGLYTPLLEQAHISRASGELFPLIRVEQLEQAGPRATGLLSTELVREFATLVMLAAVGLVCARNMRQWFAGFMISFGVWDIFYYIFLKVLADWPASLLTWDLLFLLPVPWAGPVIAPVLVAVAMITAGTIILYRDVRGRPVDLRWSHWLAGLLGGAIIIVAFCWDFRNLLAGGNPNRFNWPLFVSGLIVGIGSFLWALNRSTPQTSPQLVSDGQYN
jgi:hypothetical protein